MSIGIHWRDISNNRLDAPGISVMFTLIVSHAQRCRSVGINSAAVEHRLVQLFINTYDKTDYNIYSASFNLEETTEYN